MPLRNTLPLQLKKHAKVARARCCEAIGWYRYSAPASGAVDRLLAELLPNGSTFLEVGANDGYSQSNTYFLERVRGWNGILIEPIPHLYESCRRVRRAHVVHAACVTEPQPPGASVELISADLASTAPALVSAKWRESRRGRRVSAPAMTVSQIIDASPFSHIHAMSIDVEGSESALLGGLDWSRHTPDYMVIEVWEGNDLIPRLEQHMTFDRRLNERDVLFRRRD